MNENVRRRLFGFDQAFNHSVVPWTVGAIVVVLVLSAVVIVLMRRAGRIADETYHEVMLRWRSWLFLSVILLAPVLLGAAWVMGAVCLLSLLCYQEFARSTGLF